MTGMNQFLTLFGGIPLSTVIEFILACVFVYLVYAGLKKHFEKMHSEHLDKESKISEAVEAAKQSRELKYEIDGLKASQDMIIKKIENLETGILQRERNKLRDRLLQNYRYYTNKTKNPSQSWTSMEAEAFWEMFRDYEAAGGNGYMHTEVQPAMDKLTVISIDK